MAMKTTIEEHREGAVVFTNPGECRRSSVEVLEMFGLPQGLLPLPVENLLEAGRNEKTGFVWLRQRRSHEFTFKKVGRPVWYDKEVTAFVENGRMRRITGVKSKELLIWLTVDDISIDGNNPEYVVFRTPSRLSRSFPASAFGLDQD